MPGPRFTARKERIRASSCLACFSSTAPAAEAPEEVAAVEQPSDPATDKVLSKVASKLVQLEASSQAAAPLAPAPATPAGAGAVAAEAPTPAPAQPQEGPRSPAAGAAAEEEPAAPEPAAGAPEEEQAQLIREPEIQAAQPPAAEAPQQLEQPRGRWWFLPPSPFSLLARVVSPHGAQGENPKGHPASPMTLPASSAPQPQHSPLGQSPHSVDSHPLEGLARSGSLVSEGSLTTATAQRELPELSPVRE